MSQKLLEKNKFTPHKYLPNFHLKFDFLERLKMPLSFQSTRNRRQQRKMKKMTKSTVKAEENEAKVRDSNDTNRLSVIHDF